MSNTSVESQVFKIVSEQLGISIDKVTSEASFVEDLGADSLDTVELVMALEEEFDMEIPDHASQKIKTVGDAIIYIQKQTEAA